MNVRPISGASVAGPGGESQGHGRRGLGLIAGALVLFLAACGGGGGKAVGVGADDGKGSATQQAKQSTAAVVISPKSGAVGVDTSGALKVSVAKGRLTEVTVKDAKGTEVDGTITGGGATWTPSTHLAAATKYTVHAVAKDSAGREAAEDSYFTTLTPKNTFVGYFTPEDGSTVGVGMPFSIRFTRGITKPQDVERAIRIKTEPAVDVEGHWFGNDRLDFRPEHYWKSGTKVTVDLDLNGVEGRDGVYGKQHKTVRFTIGRDRVSYVDAEKHTMKVTQGGKVVRTIPVTAGKPGYDTWNGVMVMSQKFTVTRMNSETVGYGSEYDIKDVPHAIRLTDSGTFVHGNYWGGGAFGNDNSSHGCVGLRDVRGGYDGSTPAAWFFSHSILGDVVVVRHSHDRTVDPANGLNGWNMSWADWKK